MYESLTSLLPKLQGAEYGEWIIDRENDGSPEHPKQFPFVAYGRAVTDLENAIYRFIDEHKEMELTRYGDILEKANIKWDAQSMKYADVSDLDGRTVMALLVGAVRAERFCDGALLAFCEGGNVAKWLQRLKELDEMRKNALLYKNLVDSELERKKLIIEDQERIIKKYATDKNKTGIAPVLSADYKENTQDILLRTHIEYDTDYQYPISFSDFQ